MDTSSGFSRNIRNNAEQHSSRTLGLDNVKCGEQTHNGPGVILQIVNARVDRLDGAVDYVHANSCVTYERMNERMHE
jgi:hypothetical protein